MWQQYHTSVPQCPTRAVAAPCISCLDEHPLRIPQRGVSDAVLSICHLGFLHVFSLFRFQKGVNKTRLAPLYMYVATEKSDRKKKDGDEEEIFSSVSRTSERAAVRVSPWFALRAYRAAPCKAVGTHPLLPEKSSPECFAGPIIYAEPILYLYCRTRQRFSVAMQFVGATIVTCVYVSQFRW